MSDKKGKKSGKVSATKGKTSSGKDTKKNTSKKVNKKTPAKRSVASKEVFVLPVIVDITSVSDLHKDLSKVVKNEKKNVILDSSKVEKITTSAVQVILAFFKVLEEGGVKYSISNVSDAFEQSLKDIGFAKQLKEWVK